jgi:hypothetical protein
MKHHRACRGDTQKPRRCLPAEWANRMAFRHPARYSYAPEQRVAKQTRNGRVCDRLEPAPCYAIRIRSGQRVSAALHTLHNAQPQTYQTPGPGPRHPWGRGGAVRDLDSVPGARRLHHAPRTTPSALTGEGRTPPAVCCPLSAKWPRGRPTPTRGAGAAATSEEDRPPTWDHWDQPGIFPHPDSRPKTGENSHSWDPSPVPSGYNSSHMPHATCT